MAELAPLLATIRIHLGDTELPLDLLTIEIPLRTKAAASTDDAAHFTIDVNRTQLRTNLAKSVRQLADSIEAAHPDPTKTDSSKNPATGLGTDQSQGDLSSLPDPLTGGRTCACAEGEYAMADVGAATAVSIGAADHLDVDGKDAGAIAALFALAHKIDNYDTVLEHILRQIAADPESNVRPPAADNVALPTYLKYSESLGLTPGGRGELTAGKNSTAAPKDALTDFLSGAGIS